jgi:hypothetical protein
MLHVVCGRCGQTFEAADDAAEEGEACPYCGAAVEEESGEPMIEFQPAKPFELFLDDQKSAKGIPAPLWWLIAIAGIAAFVMGVIIMLRGDDWERQHLQELTDEDRRATIYMYAANFPAAAKQYDSIVAALSGRDIQSIYLKQLLDQARQGSAEARRREAIAASQKPASGAPASRPVQVSVHDAIVNFQRDAESFPQFIRSHAFLFEDSQGNWRRRQYVVWNVEANLEPQSDPPEMNLKYTCNSRMTAGHSVSQDASGDADFRFDERPDAISCQVHYEFLSGRWIPGEREPESELDMSELVKLEVGHFGSATDSH